MSLTSGLAEKTIPVKLLQDQLLYCRLQQFFKFSARRQFGVRLTALAIPNDENCGKIL